MSTEVLQSLRSKLSASRELLQFFWRNKWWWLIPMVLGLLALGVLIVLAQSSSIAPFIYTLF